MFEKWFKKEDGADAVKIGNTEDKARGVSTDMLTTEVVPESVNVVLDKAIAPESSDVSQVVPDEVAAAFQPPVPEAQLPQLTYKEAKSLKKARYESIVDNPRFKNSYVLLNQKTGQVVEIKAASSFHACNIIGWKYKQVKVIMVNSLDKSEESSTINK